MKKQLLSLLMLLAGALSVYGQQTQEADLFISKHPDKLFTGALIEAESLNKTDYRMIEAHLQPVTLSCSLGGKAVTILPSYDNLMEAVRHFVQTAGSNRPNLEFSFSTQELDTYAEAATFFGQTINPKNYFGTETKSKRTLTAFLLSQSFFQITMDLPESLCTDEAIKEQADRLIYPSTLNFGRLVIVTVESPSGKAEVQAVVSKALKGEELSSADKALLATATLRIITLGEESIPVAHPDNPLADVLAYLNRPFGTDDFGQPVRFRASYLKDHSAFVNRY